MKKNLSLYFLFLIALFNSAYSYDIDKKGIVQPMSPPQLVNDFAGMLNSADKQSLESKLLDYNNSTSTQIYIVTIESLGDYAVEDYALQVGRSWGIGQKDKNNGILILISKEDRKIDIEVGYGLESYVTDYDSKRIIDELITPAFKLENYYAGLDAATDKLISLLQGTPYASETEASQTTEAKEIPSYVFIIIIVLIIILMIRFPILARIAFIVLSSGGSSSGSSRSGGFGGGGGGSFGGGGSSGSW
jgi:uncharacterized protein